MSDAMGPRRRPLEPEYNSMEAEDGTSGPFMLQRSNEGPYEVLSGSFTAPPALLSAESVGHEDRYDGETPLPQAQLNGPSMPYSPDPDPYSAIRPAMLPAHAHLTADEITINLGRRPAVIALHQALASPLPQQAALAVLLGSGGRRSTHVHGHDMPIPVYLRLLSRLCREAAEHGEQEYEAGNAPGTGIRDLTKGSTGPDVREVQKALNARTKAGLQPDGILGPQTEAAIIAFQRANALQVDGTVGQQTRHALFPLVGVTLHAVGTFGTDSTTTVALQSAPRQPGEAPAFTMEDPPGSPAPAQAPTDNIWQLLIPTLPNADPSDQTLDTFQRPHVGLALPIPHLLTKRLLTIPGMKLDSRQVQPGFQFNTSPLWQSSKGSPNPSGALVLAIQSVLALNKEKPGHLEVTEGFQLGLPLFATTSDGRAWTLQWYAQATWVDPFWRRGRWHLVQPFAQFSTQLDLQTASPTLGLGAFPVNIQVDIKKDKLSLFMQAGLVASWDLVGERVEVGGQVIGGLNITLGGK
jgi:hypothetical protein